MPLHQARIAIHPTTGRHANDDLDDLAAERGCFGEGGHRRRRSERKQWEIQEVARVGHGQLLRPRRLIAADLALALHQPASAFIAAGECGAQQDQADDAANFEAAHGRAQFCFRDSWHGDSPSAPRSINPLVEIILSQIS
jgi:hypothetical protein